MKGALSIMLLVGLLSGCATGNPQSTVAAYPAKGQSVEQQQRDMDECRGWAERTTGYSPAGDTAKGAGIGAAIGALGGAAAGAAIGAATGSPGTGAAIGAAAGGIGGAGIGGTHQYSKSKQGFERAYANCMSARGYTVSH